MNRLIARKKLILFFCLSLAVRLFYGATHISFGQDHARDWLIMEDLRANNTVLVGYGPKASVGDFYLPPLYYQLNYIVSLATGNDELAMMWLTIMVESITAVILYLILNYFVSSSTSFFVSLLYIISPIGLYFGTMMWNPNMIPFFSSLALLSVFKYLVDDMKAYIAVGLVATTVALHLHYQSVVLLLFWIILFFWSIFKDKASVKWWLLGILVSMLTLLPYFSAEVGNNWQNTNNIVTYFTQEHTRTFERVSKPAYFFSFLPAFTERVLIGGNTQSLWLGRVVFWGGLVIMGFLAYLKKGRFAWIAIYFLSIFFMLRMYRGDKIDYYMSMLFVMPYFLLSFIANKFPLPMSSQFAKRTLLWGIYNFFIIFLLVFVAYRAGRHIQQVPMENGLQNLISVTEFIKNRTNNQAIKLFSHNQDIVNNFRYSFYKLGISEDSQSNIWIDVCSKNQPCVWNTELICRHNKYYSQAAWSKFMENYRLTTFASIGAYQVVIGTLN